MVCFSRPSCFLEKSILDNAVQIRRWKFSEIHTVLSIDKCHFLKVSPLSMLVIGMCFSCCCGLSFRDPKNAKRLRSKENKRKVNIETSIIGKTLIFI